MLLTDLECNVHFISQRYCLPHVRMAFYVITNTFRLLVLSMARARKGIFCEIVEVSIFNTTLNVNKIWLDMALKEPAKHPQLFFWYMLLLYSFLGSLMVLMTESLIQKIVVVILQWFPTTVEDDFIATNIMNKVLWDSIFFTVTRLFFFFFKLNSLPW